MSKRSPREEIESDIKRVRLTLESYEETPIESIKDDGQEVPIKAQTGEEKFASTIQLFRFPVEQQSYNDHTVDDPRDPKSAHVELKQAYLQRPPKPYPFNKTLSELSAALHEMDVVEDLARTLKQAQYLTVVNIQRTSDLSMSSTASDLLKDEILLFDEKEEENEGLKLFRSKNFQLKSALQMLQRGSEKAKDRIQKDHDHHQSLFRIQSEFTLRANSSISQGKRSTMMRQPQYQHVVDIGLGSGLVPPVQFRHVSVGVIRRDDNILDLAFPAACTSGRRTILSSKISNKESLQDDDIDDKIKHLYQAQDSILDQELFMLLSNACTLIQSVVVLEKTENRIILKLNVNRLLDGGFIHVLLSLEPNGVWRELRCSVDTGVISDSHDQMILVLLKSALLQIHQDYSEWNKERNVYHSVGTTSDQTFDNKIVERLEFVLSEACHRICCKHVVGLLKKNVTDLKIEVVAWNAPNATSLRLNENLMLHLRSSQLELRGKGMASTIPFASTLEMICFIKDSKFL
ncbi:hypothetical protein AKO1_011043 [Acrasis kona]|uniref:Mediator of RNA polymerase II transcription subunit 17 n=1 Tax=Acrasis kona TaxID=1008807 RepID=A0AAW2YUF5_9EUKA